MAISVKTRATVRWWTLQEIGKVVLGTGKSGFCGEKLIRMVEEAYKPRLEHFFAIRVASSPKGELLQPTPPPSQAFNCVDRASYRAFWKQVVDLKRLASQEVGSNCT